MSFSLKLLAKPTVKQLASQIDEHKDYVKAAEEQENLYRSPSGYLQWNIQLRACFMSGTAEVAIRGYTSKDILAVKVGELAREAILHSAPARYITKEMCEAFMQTPTPVLSKEILNVLPWMHIMLPRNTVFDHTGDEVVSLIVYCGILYPENIPQESLGREVMKEFFPGEIETPPEYFGASGIQVATITPGGSNLWQEFIDKDAKSWQDEHIKQREHSGYEHEKTEMIMRIAINSLLVHLYEPELISTDSVKVSPGTGFGGSPEKSPLGPTWIGKGFRYQREQTSAPGGQGRAKAGVRAHWRRGHWHTILHGKGKQERRVQWFKPVFVGSSTG
jgi:hypothetical protein